MNIILLFTYSVSLREWDYKGLIDREILLYRRLMENNHDVNFITYGGKEDLDIKGKIGNIKVFPVYERMKKSKHEIVNILKTFFIPFQLKDIFRAADIIKTNQMLGAWVGLIAKFVCRKKLIVRCGFEWYRNAYARRAKRWSFFKNTFAYILEWLVYHYCDEIIVSNETDLEFIKSTFKIRGEKLNLIRNYVDTDIFKPLSSVKKEDSRLLYVGRFEPRKNILNILKAIKDTPYSLDVVGYGEERVFLEDFVRENYLDVKFLGIIPNNKLPEVINKYNVLILASLYENSPKVIIEAMSCGIAVIGADTPGIQEIIKHRENGFLCYTNILSIKRSIEAVMTDKALRDSIGANGRKYVLENCSLDIALDKEMRVYKKLYKSE